MTDLMAASRKVSGARAAERRPARAKPSEVRIVVGWREWVTLPELGTIDVKAKLDTGARTSALHAFDITELTIEGAKWVQFSVHPFQRDDVHSTLCLARLVDRRFVTNSGGHRERRHVIATTLRIGQRDWPIELTLANRDQMGFRLLIGRTAMHHRLIVDPSRSYCASKNRPTTRVKPLRPSQRTRNQKEISK